MRQAAEGGYEASFRTVSKTDDIIDPSDRTSKGEKNEFMYKYEIFGKLRSSITLSSLYDEICLVSLEVLYISCAIFSCGSPAHSNLFTRCDSPEFISIFLPSSLRPVPAIITRRRSLI